MSNSNRSKNANKKSELSGKFTFAVSMYHKNGDRMTTEENVALIADEDFPMLVSEQIFQDIGDYSEREIRANSSAVNKFIIVTVPITVHPDSGFYYISHYIKFIQDELNHKFYNPLHWLTPPREDVRKVRERTGDIKVDDDVFIKSITILELAMETGK